MHLTGNQKTEACAAHRGAAVPHLHIPGGWAPHVVPVVRAEGLHGHVVGLRQVPRHCVCGESSSSSASTLKYDISDIFMYFMITTS